MGTKLFVGNISWNVKDEQLQELFSQYGEVTDAFIMKDRANNNRSKGFGFVTLATPEQAQAAIEALNGHEFDGRALTVNEARPPQNRD